LPALLNDRVNGGEQTGGHGEAKPFGGLKVDDKIEFSGLRGWV